MNETIALFGAAGKIGTRIADKLRESSDYRTLYVERTAGQEHLRLRGLEPTDVAVAVKEADVVVLAVPDTVLAQVAAEVVPQLSSGALVVCLDPAVAYAGLLPERDDVAYFTVHPCHPPVINDEVEPDARMDFYGGIKAKQPLVCALVQGQERDYERGEAVSRALFAPVLRTHRLTVEQMAVLEPAMAETVVLTCMFIMREAMEEAIRRGVPPAAARDFLMGHINVNLGIQYGYLGDTQFSDAALLMVERAKQQLIKPDWKNVFEPDNIRAQVEAIVSGADKV